MQKLMKFWCFFSSLLCLMFFTVTNASAAECEHIIKNHWNTGFQAVIRITNHGSSTIHGWKVNWEYSDGSLKVADWNANISGNNPLTATALSWNSTIEPGQSVEFGLLGNKAIPNSAPPAVTVTGAICGVDQAKTTNTSSSLPNFIAPDFGNNTCSVDYTVTNDWGNGFLVDLVITNNSNSHISGYNIAWNLGKGETFNNGWNATFSSTGSTITASNPAGHWNGELSANGGTAAFGFQIANNLPPATVINAFTLNGVGCNDKRPDTDSPPFSSDGTLLPLIVDGKQVKSSKGTPVHLHGVATTDLHAIYNGFYVPELSDTVAGSHNLIDHIRMINAPIWNNANIMRLTVHPSVNDRSGHYGWNSVEPDFYMNEIIEPALSTVIDAKRYAIIDWHYVGAEWTGLNADNTVKFWHKIASSYANHPNILFELFNEPGHGSWADWQQTAQGWINAIRTGNWSQYGLPVTPPADNIIIVGGPTYSQVLPQNLNDAFFTGGNIVYANHIYPAHANKGIPDWAEFTLQFHPVFFTEWGYENNTDAYVTKGSTSGYGKQFQSYLNKHPNAHWVAWNWSPTYRSVMFDMNYVLLGNGQSTQASRFHGGNPDTYDNYMGQFVVDWLDMLGNGNVE